MPTNKPRFTITIDNETLEQVNDFRYKNRVQNQSKAITQLVQKGLSSLQFAQ